MEPPTPEAREIFLGQVCPGLQWLMPRMAKAVPHFGYVPIPGTRPA